MTATAILSVPVTAVPAAPTPSESPVMSDVGAFGALLQQQVSPQPQGNPQALVPVPSLTAEALPVDVGQGEGGSRLPIDAPLPEMDAAQIQDAASAPVRPAPGVEVADKLPADAVPSGEILPVIDAAVRSDAEILKLPLPEVSPVEADDGDVPSADETVADALDANATPTALVQQPPPAQIASLAVAGAPALTDSPVDGATQNEAVTSVEPDAAQVQGDDRSPALWAKPPELAKGDSTSGAATVSQQTPAGGNATLSDAAVLADGVDNGLSSSLLTQTMPAISAKPAGSPYPLTQTVPHQPIVKAEPGAIGGKVGLEIAKVAKAGRDDLLIRLDPREMGRVDVRLSFDSDGVLRAVVSAESPAALEMLRRESGDLNRALADAGVRSDAQSLRFDARPGGQGSGSGEGWQRDQQQQQQHGASQARGLADHGALDLPDPIYGSLNASGHVDLMA